MNTTATDRNWEVSSNIDAVKDNFRTIDGLLSDLYEFTVIALDHIKDANGELDEDSHTFEDLDEVAALSEDIQKLIEHAMDKADKATRIIENA